MSRAVWGLVLMAAWALGPRAARAEPEPTVGVVVVEDVYRGRNMEGIRRGEIKDFTGVDAAFEAPINPDVEVKTDQIDIGDSVEKILTFVRRKNGTAPS